MPTALHPNRESRTAPQQYATFYVGDILLGVDICAVQEINRQAEATRVPHAPEHIRGVINLRGDVATVVDLRNVLGLPRVEVTRDSRNLIVHSQDEAIGLLVDRVADIVAIAPEDISPSPANLNGVDGRFFRGVYATESAIIVLLDIEQALADVGAQT